MKIGECNIASKTALMGILNVTPDSFSDGGCYDVLESAMSQVESMIKSGVDVIDIGGESTRPGATFVTAQEEIERVVPVIKAIKKRYSIPISIDTYKTETAKAALEAGADILNDVWAGLYDGQMMSLAAEKNVPYILMHNQENEIYSDITQEVVSFLKERIQVALDTGVCKQNIWIDPGFGFAKSAEDNIKLLKELDKITEIGYPVLFGISRKRTVDTLLGGNTSFLKRDMGTAALTSYALMKGCQMVRVHNVEVNRDIVKVINQLI